MDVEREGLGENSRFYRCHPLLNFTYFLFVIGTVMFANHPVFLLMSFACAWIYSLMLRGRKAWKFNAGVTAISLVLVPLLNVLNVHNGVTVLFYLNGNRVTLEAAVYGVVMAVMMSGMILWFSCFSVIVTGDKIVYLLGRIAPVIALTISMVFRFLPLLMQRYREISAGQRCMGRQILTENGVGKLTLKTIVTSVRQVAREISILVAWSLEAAIETSDSMEGRGYGLKHRTSYHLYKLSREDGILWLVMVAAGLLSTAFCVDGTMSVYYYPAILIPPPEIKEAAAIAAYGGLLSIPLLMDEKGRREWKRLHLKG